MTRCFWWSFFLTALVLAPMPSAGHSARQAVVRPAPVRADKLAMPTGFLPAGDGEPLVAKGVAVAIVAAGDTGAVIACRNRSAAAANLDLLIVIGRSSNSMVSRVVMPGSPRPVHEERVTVALAAGERRKLTFRPEQLAIRPTTDPTLEESYLITVKSGNASTARFFSFTR